MLPLQFAQNAGLGYVKKPAWMLEHVGRSHAVPCSSIPLNPLPLRPTPWTLQLHLFSAFCHQSVVQACYCMRDDLFLQVRARGIVVPACYCMRGDLFLQVSVLGVCGARPHLALDCGRC